MASIYEQMKAAGVAIDNHATDLYVPVNNTTTAILKGYKYRSNVVTFVSQIDGALWYDIPFAYDPEWAAREKTCEAWAAGLKG